MRAWIEEHRASGLKPEVVSWILNNIQPNVDPEFRVFIADIEDIDETYEDAPQDVRDALKAVAGQVLVV